MPDTEDGLDAYVSVEEHKNCRLVVNLRWVLSLLRTKKASLAIQPDFPVEMSIWEASLSSKGFQDEQELMIEQYDDLSHSQPWLAGCSKEGCIGRQDRMIACDLQVYYPVWDMCLILQQLLLFLFLPLHLGTRCITLGSVHYPLSFY